MYIDKNNGIQCNCLDDIFGFIRAQVMLFCYKLDAIGRMYEL